MAITMDTGSSGIEVASDNGVIRGSVTPVITGAIAAVTSPIAIAVRRVAVTGAIAAVTSPIAIAVRRVAITAITIAISRIAVTVG
jgi:hypothetical protein